MLTHMLYARAARGYKKPDIDAHANFSCQVNILGQQISSAFGSIFSRLTGLFGR